MPTTACGDATRLLDTYRAALAAYEKVRSLVPQHITFHEAAQLREDAHVATVRARRAYWKHVDEHACRRVVVERNGVAGKIRISLHLSPATE